MVKLEQNPDSEKTKKTNLLQWSRGQQQYYYSFPCCLKGIGVRKLALKVPETDVSISQNESA